ncbi:flagellar biosynthetic protein FliR [Zooshikella ganghwensis]|uniref:flagellar biosynthetic protein FliR n=1 Tax=Zooshikella ganghwensis TaxID=202772 RepID=UPI0003FAEF3C|nr:flagellar biosynthetic protein FliR [Zooshikella ganghwensis]
MVINFDVTWLYALLLTTTRIGIVLFALFQAGGIKLPWLIKGTLSITLGLILLPFVDQSVGLGQPDIIHLILLMVKEVILGMLLATGIYFVFGAINLAGRVIDTQTGINAMAAFDPHSQSMSGFTTQLLRLLVLSVFFFTNQHHNLLYMLVFSLQKLNPLQFYEVNIAHAIQFLPNVFLFGIRLAAPVIALVFIGDIMFGLLSKTMPQLNVYFLTLPIKILLGLLLLICLLPSFTNLNIDILGSLIDYWQSVLN